MFGKKSINKPTKDLPFQGSLFSTAFHFVRWCLSGVFFYELFLLDQNSFNSGVHRKLIEYESQSVISPFSYLLQHPKKTKGKRQPKTFRSLSNGNHLTQMTHKLLRNFDGTLNFVKELIVHVGLDRGLWSMSWIKPPLALAFLWIMSWRSRCSAC